HVAEDQQSEQEGDRHEAHPDVWQGGTGDDDERPGYAEGPPEHSGRLMLRVVLSKLLFADLEHSISVATAPDTTSRDAGSLIAGDVMTRWGTGFSFTVTHNDDAVRQGQSCTLNHRLRAHLHRLASAEVPSTVALECMDDAA